MLYYLIHDPIDNTYTIWYRLTADSNFCYNADIEYRWGSTEYAFSTFTTTPKNLDQAHLQSFNIVLEFTTQSNPEFFI